MSLCDSPPSGEPTDRATTVAAALAQLGVRPEEGVLIMLPDGPGFIDAFVGTMRQGAVPLPVNPRLAAADVAAIAAETGARLVLAPAERIHGLADLGTEPPVPVDGPQGLWAAVLRRR
ncbi:MAG: AMP-binding protein [Pseudonocardiaceae bacterium]